MRKTHSIVLLLAFALAGLACDAPEPAEESGMEAGEMMDTAAAPAVSEMPPAEDTMMAPGQLTAIDQSGVHGTVDVEWGDEEVEVTVEVEGLEPGATYAAHIHEGRCAAGGPVAIPLEDVVAGADGTGTATTSASMEGMAMGAEHFVQLHDSTGTAVACADVESHAMTEAG